MNNQLLKTIKENPYKGIKTIFIVCTNFSGHFNMINNSRIKLVDKWIPLDSDVGDTVSSFYVGDFSHKELCSFVEERIEYNNKILNSSDSTDFYIEIRFAFEFEGWNSNYTEEDSDMSVTEDVLNDYVIEIIKKYKEKNNENKN